jgi:hypothetical protein
MARLAFALLALVLTAGLALAQGPDERLNAINKTKIIKIAYRTDARPFSYLNENKEPAGYTVDLCKLVARSLEKQLGVPELDIQWVPVTTQTRFEAVANGMADMECGSSTATLSRMKARRPDVRLIWRGTTRSRNRAWTLDTEIGTGVLTHALMIFCPLTRKSPCEVFGTHTASVGGLFHFIPRASCRLTDI